MDVLEDEHRFFEQKQEGNGSLFGTFRRRSDDLRLLRCEPPRRADAGG